MNKYTIIYNEGMRIGSHTVYVTKMERVETDNISKLIEDDKYEMNVVYIFMGWPLMEGEKEIQSPA